MILAGKNEAEMRSVKELTSRFDIKDLGKLSYFLGMSIVQDQEETWIGQPTYAEKLLTKMGMSDCKPVKIPADPANHLVKAAEDEQAVDQQLYQSLVGGLMYLATCTRPDIAYTVGMLARFSSKPNQTHWVAAKRVLRYLKGTMNFGLIYSGDAGVLGYSDADWAGDMDFRLHVSDRRWACIMEKQDTVALSTAEAEYVALSSAAQECVWMRRLISELGNPPGEPTTILEDNQSSIAMARNPVSQEGQAYRYKASFRQGASEQWNDRTQVLPNMRDGGRYPDERTTPTAVLCSSRDGRNGATENRN